MDDDDDFKLRQSKQINVGGAASVIILVQHVRTGIKVEQFMIEFNLQGVGGILTGVPL